MDIHGGQVSPGWAEWNDLLRDCVRDYWRGADGKLAEFAQPFTGSPDLYKGGYRSPTASINLVTAHDGFTLHDLVSFNEKHNQANGEDNNDGANDNCSWNCCVEGPTEGREINALRDPVGPAASLSTSARLRSFFQIPNAALHSFAAIGGPQHFCDRLVEASHRSCQKVQARKLCGGHGERDHAHLCHPQFKKQ